MSKLKIKPFAELTGSEVYELAALRQDVFILEQNCVYKDLDHLDRQSTHLLLYADQVKSNNELQGCLRIVPPQSPGAKVALGRLAVRETARRNGFGFELIRAGLETAEQQYPGMGIGLSGQAYLQKFYESLGFVAEGGIYDEDGIPHREFNYRPKC